MAQMLPPPGGMGGNPYARTTYNNTGIDTTAQGYGLPTAGDQLGGLMNSLLGYKLWAAERGYNDQNDRLNAEEGRRSKAFNAQMQQGETNDQRGRAEQLRALMQSRTPENGPTPASFGRFQMNHTGNWGTMVDPANIPVEYQDKIMGGFYGQAGNWDSSNPSITGPQQLSTKKYTSGASGAGSHMSWPGSGVYQTNPYLDREGRG